MFRCKMLAFLMLLFSCNTEPKKIAITEKHKKEGYHIYLHPFNNFNSTTLHFIQNELQSFFKVPIAIMANQQLEDRFLNFEKGKRYSADSIIKNLSSQEENTAFIHVGLTHEDIFTTMKHTDGTIKAPLEKYSVWGVFGLGYMPGKASVVSDKRLFTKNAIQYRHRIRTVVLHEIGHNLGLPHCATIHCIMSDANEKISTVDNSSDTMCYHCKKLIPLFN